MPVLAAAIAVPTATASTPEPFAFTWDSAGPFERVLYSNESPVSATRLQDSRAFSTLTIDALETNASDMTIDFACGAVSSGHTNTSGQYAAAVGVWVCGSASRVFWTESPRAYNALPVTSEFVIPANTLSVGTNVFPLTWKLTPTTIIYPGPYGLTRSGFTTTVSHGGATIFSHTSTGYLADSPDPLHMDMSDIFG